MVLFIGLLMISTASAQPGSASQTAPSAAQQSSPYVLTQSLIGSTLWSKEGENLGLVQGVIIDTRNGRVTQLVVAPSVDLEGLKNRLVAVPWQKLQAAPGPKLVLQADKATLARAPSFPSGRMPEFAEEQWHEKVYGWWQVPYGAPLTSAGGARQAGPAIDSRALGLASGGMGTGPTEMGQR
jgi:sporulation protein YlmC with PRC-barrel domain